MLLETTVSVYKKYISLFLYKLRLLVHLVEHVLHRSWQTGFDPGRAVPENLKTAHAACPASCSALVDGCKETVHAGCYH